MDVKIPVKFIVKGTGKVLSPEENAKLKEQEQQDKARYMDNQKDADLCRK